MPGMGGGGLTTGNPVIIDAFHSLVFHQLLFVVGICLAGSLVWLMLSSSGGQTTPAGNEPRVRAVLRSFFGCLWILDGLLQYQPQMPLGFASGVLRGGAASSPEWVRNLVDAAASIGDRQPIILATAVIWIQVGIGVWMLVARRGLASRLAGAASAVWALIIWVVSGFGGVFAAGASLVIGQPGASLLYAAAGLLIAAPLSWWAGDLLLIRARRGLGVFLLAMVALQAFPGRGMWSGTIHGKVTNPISLMTSDMASVHQLAVTAWAVRSFGDLTSNAPVLVNGFFVAVFAGTGVLLMSGNPAQLRLARIIGLTGAGVAWVFVENFGLFGGLSTDPNTMVPLIGLLTSLTAAPRPVAQVAADLAAPPEAALDLATAHVARRSGLVVAMMGSVVSVAIIALGVIPATAVWAKGTTDPLLAETLNEPPQQVNFSPYPFHLQDGNGRDVSMASFSGKVVALTFLDPVCLNDCPEIASEMVVTSELLGSSSSKVAMVAVVANPTYTSAEVMRAFNQDQHLTNQANWHFLTGKLSELERVWAYYAASTANAPGGSMAIHSDLTYLIDPKGRVRTIIQSTPGNTGVLHDSYSALLARLMRKLL